MSTHVYGQIGRCVHCQGTPAENAILDPNDCPKAPPPAVPVTREMLRKVVRSRADWKGIEENLIAAFPNLTYTPPPTAGETTP